MQMPSSYAILDTETTGLRCDLGHRIMEIAVIAVDGPTSKVYHSFIQPDREPDPRAAAVNRITPEMLEDAPRFGEVADDILNFFGHRPIYIHHANFDMGFVNKELQLASREPISPKRSICTLEMAKRRMPTLPGHKLMTIARALRIDFDRNHLHGALGDAKLLHQVVQRMPD